MAYASCPICARLTHMCDMLTHLTTAHRELNPAHCQSICEERLKLYERVIGVPLKKVELTSSGHRFLDFLPTLMPTGYICNWCETRNEVHSTRDKFLKHVADMHTEIDLEDIEPHVPLLPRAAAAIEEGGEVSNIAQPTRRLGGVEAVAEKSEMPVLMTRTLGISVPRGIDTHARPAPPSGASNKASASNEPDFLCELCGRTFQSEPDLLQHLETRHPDGTVGKHGGVENSAAAEVAEFAAREATAGGGQRVQVVCDLCPSSSKVYTMPSALFSHIRFKHPGEDAAFHVERLIRQQKTTTSFVCKVCNKAFATESALEGHFSSKHGTQSDGTSGHGRTKMNNCWWCHDCEKGFSSAKGLHGHMQNKHGLPSQSHPCPACKRVFADVYSLEEHLSLQHKTIRVSDIGLLTHAKCNSCYRCFLSLEDLHRHAVRHHKKDPRAPLQAFEGPSTSSSPADRTATAASDVDAEEAAPLGPRKVKKRKKVVSESEGGQ